MALVFKTPKSAINTTTKTIQNLGNGECPPCPECPEINLETADVEYTENGEYTLTPEGDGFSKVDITVNIDTKAIEDAAYAEGEAAGIVTGKAQGVAEQKAKLTSTTITENGTTTREDGWNSVTVNVDVTTPYNNGVAAGEAAQKAKLTSGTFVSNGTYNREDGYNSVTVNVPSDINNQDKTVNPSTTQQTVSADKGYSGLGQVTVNAVTSSIDQNIQANNIKSGVSILGVQGSYDPQPNLETGEFEIATVGTSTFTPDRADGFDSVEIRVLAQPIGSPTNPFDSIQTVLDTDFEDGYYYGPIVSGEMNERTGYYDAVDNDGRTVFHIKPYSDNPDFDPENPDPEVPEYIFPEDFDLAGKDIIVYFNKANIISPENQAKTPLLRVASIDEFNDCDLFAVNYNSDPDSWPFGTLRVTKNGTVDPSGYAEIDVDVQPTLQTKSVTPSDRQQVITPDRYYDGLSEVTVSGVTAAIDQNITASNIKDGVTILGVTGTYDPQPSLESKTTSYTANGTYTITPSTGYDGMDEVEVTVNVPSTGSNCPDWSSIGWDCSDVAASGIDADLAYTAQKKAEYDASSGYSKQETFFNSSIVFTPTIQFTDRTQAGRGYFYGCSNLRYVRGVTFKSEYSSSKCDASYMFRNCNSLKNVTIDLTDNNPDVRYVVGGEEMFSMGNSGTDYSLNSVTITNSNGLTSALNMFAGRTKLTSVSIDDTSNITRMYGMFTNCNSLQSVPTFNTSKVTNMELMFDRCTNLSSVPLFDTSIVTTTKMMFRNCTSLTTIPQLNTSNVTNVQEMFSGCTNLVSIPELDASK